MQCDPFPPSVGWSAPLPSPPLPARRRPSRPRPHGDGLPRHTPSRASGASPGPPEPVSPLTRTTPSTTKPICSPPLFDSLPHGILPRLPGAGVHDRTAPGRPLGASPPLPAGPVSPSQPHGIVAPARALRPPEGRRKRVRHRHLLLWTAAAARRASTSPPLRGLPLPRRSRSRRTVSRDTPLRILTRAY